MTGKPRPGSALAFRLGAAALVFLGWSANAAAQIVTEYPIPRTAPYFPVDITAGSDGALWFIEQSQPHAGAVPSGPGIIGRITTAGTITQYALPSLCTPYRIAAESDGALWFTEDYTNQIGRITTAGAITEYPVPAPSPFSSPSSIAAGPDGALWFTYSRLSTPGTIGRITTAGAITEYPISASLGLPQGITAGPDGALWFTENSANQIGRITTSGTLSEFPVPTASAGLTYIAAGADGALWFTEGSGNKVGRITTSGAVTEFSMPTQSSAPAGITAGPDGALWFTEASGNNIGRITISGNITEYPIPTASSMPNGITAGSDGALWFVELAGNKVGRITTPARSGPLVAAVLPSSRSVEVGSPATAFATIINAGTTDAIGCAISPVTTVPAAFQYRPTNPATNQIIGMLNTPVSIPAGGSQSFVFGLMPNAPVVPTEVALGFDCAGVNAAASYIGLNTLLYSASPTPVPDIVALVETMSPNDGILHIGGVLTEGCAGCGMNAFAVATINLGSSATTTATATASPATLPLAMTICQTNPGGVCVGGPAGQGPSATVVVNPNDTPTFAIFAAASGAVPFDPANNRIFVEFSDANEVVRGSTSVAVETQ